MLLASVLFVSLAAQSPWQTVSSAGVSLEYRTTADSQNLEVKLTGTTTGWMAVGFNPTSVMRNANIIIGYVNLGGGVLRDDWGTSNTAHASDTSMGGTSDVLIIDANETAGNTFLHFSIPLNTGDQYDRPLVIGQSYPIILARGSNNADNFTGMHADAGNAQISLIAPVSNDDDLGTALNPNRILAVYPNPFSSSTSVKYSLAENSSVQLSIFNQRGQLVHSSFSQKAAGEHDFLWQTENLPNGIYTLQVRTGDQVSTRRLTLLRN